MQIMIFIRIHRINFQPDHFEIFSCDLTRLTNIFHIGLYTALSGKNQNFLETGLCGDIAREKKGSHGMTAKDMIEALPEVLKLAEVQSKG